MDGVRVMLPCGSERDGVALREAVLRPDADRLAALALDGGGHSLPARATRLLEAALAGDAPSAAGPGDVAALTLGDRDALLLALRGALFGERAACVASCPACGEPLDLELDVRALRAAPVSPNGGGHVLALAAGELAFRVPTVADEEAVLREAPRELRALRRALLERCVAEPDRARLDDEAMDALEERIAAADPQCETRLQGSCPACGGELDLDLDPAALLCDELRAHGLALLRDVHALALHYGWSEADVLALSPARRHAYLELVGAA